jgi:Zn ribbon nucleic-acid-binding protein
VPDRIRCPVCHGTTLLRWWRADDDAPCPECGGVGSLPFGAPALSDEAVLYRHEVHDDDGEAD